MSNGLYPGLDTQYKTGYEEWLEMLRARNPRLRKLPDRMVEKYGAQFYSEEAKNVQPFEEFTFDEDKTVRLLDDESVGHYLPRSLQMTMQKAYNESLGGMFDLVEQGITPYSLIDKNTGEPYDFNLLQKAGAFVGSFVASPVDVATLITSGGVGSWVGKGILKGTRKFATNKLANNLLRAGGNQYGVKITSEEIAKKVAARRVAEKFSEKHFKAVMKQGWKEELVKESGEKFTVDLMKPQPFLKRWTSGSAKTSALLGAYHMDGASASKMLEKSRREQDGTWVPGELSQEDIPCILKEGAIGMGTGLILGGLQTAVGANLVGKGTYTKGLMHMGEFGGEVAIFGSIPNMMRGQLPALDDEGQYVWTENGKPIQYQDEKGDFHNYTVKEGMEHSLFAIGSLKTLVGGSAKIAQIIGKKARERGAKRDALKTESKILEEMEKGTDSAELKNATRREREKVNEKISQLDAEDAQGLDQTAYENINKVVSHKKSRTVPSKLTVEKARAELENVKEHIHKNRMEGEEVPQESKALS